MFRHVQFACTMLKKKKKRSVKRQYDRYDYIHENRLKWLTVTDAVKHHLDTNLTNKPTTRDAVPFKIWQRIWKTIHSIWNEIKEVFVKRATNLLSLSPMNLHEFIAKTRLKTRFYFVRVLTKTDPKGEHKMKEKKKYGKFHTRVLSVWL